MTIQGPDDTIIYEVSVMGAIIPGYEISIFLGVTGLSIIGLVVLFYKKNK